MDDNITGYDVMQLFFSSAEKYSPDQYKLRLLFGGAEIKESDHLYQHVLKDGYTIQILRTKKDIL